MNAARYNLRIIRGDDFIGRYRITTENQTTSVRTPIDLTGWSVEAKLTGVYGSVDISFVSSFEDAQDGIVRISLSSFSTLILPRRNSLWHLALTNPALLKTTYMSGSAYFITPGEGLP